MEQPCSNKIPLSGGCSAAGSVLSFNRDKVQKYSNVVRAMPALLLWEYTACVCSTRWALTIQFSSKARQPPRQCFIPKDRTRGRVRQTPVMGSWWRKCQSGALQDCRDLALQCRDSLVADFLVDYCSSNSDSLSDSALL